MFSALLLCPTPVLGILRKGSLLFDVMTIEPDDIDNIVKAISEVHKQISLKMKHQ
jgi:hypothetical protein